MSDSNADLDFGSIKLSESTEIVFAIDSYGGRRSAHIRKFVHSKKYDGPTKQGIRFDPSHLDDLHSAIKYVIDRGDTIKVFEILRIKKSDKIDIVIRCVSDDDGIGLDIREWVVSDKYTGWSKKGVRLPNSAMAGCLEKVNQMILADHGILPQPVFREPSLTKPKKMPQKEVRSALGTVGVPVSLLSVFEEEGQDE